MDYTQVCSRTRVSSCGTTTAKYLATSGWETNWNPKYSLLMRWRIKTWVEILTAQAIFCLISLRSHRSHYCKFLESDILLLCRRGLPLTTSKTSELEMPVTLLVPHPRMSQPKA